MYYANVNYRPFRGRPMNFELLKDAAAIIDGIPVKAFNLEQICKSKGETLSCGTVACAAGWLSLHPTFAKKIKPLVKTDAFGNTEIVWNLRDGYSTCFYGDAMSELFNIPHDDAKTLFGQSEIYNDGSGQSHKKEFRKRIVAYLRHHGQLTKKTPKIKKGVK